MFKLFLQRLDYEMGVFMGILIFILFILHSFVFTKKSFGQFSIFKVYIYFLSDGGNLQHTQVVTMSFFNLIKNCAFQALTPLINKQEQEPINGNGS